MVIDTRYFGNIDMPDDKIIHFESGIPGFKEYKDYVLLYDIDNEEHFFSWLQSAENKDLAFPVIDPAKIITDYNPVLEDGLLSNLGEFEEEDLVVLLLATVPAGHPEDTTVNIKAPIIVNSKTRLGMQIVAENPEYVVKYRIVQDNKKQEQ
ncbi:MAG: flagellar assembly protein FliW [Lachnospiraceae bacterium]|nr:flagellar assembly protein FliW [Lachnospiraceae bacterium]MEE3460587.1 flagellar assembly protein FliW [Lachnospiraceae bacterium]